MAKALYRKYRSKTLDEIVGQTHVTDVLKRSLAQGRIAHAYLFTGPRGVGKTSIARILAHEINQLPYQDDTPHLDIIEIDAASNNSVEDIRDLRDKVQIAPVAAHKKVYIIDEVHMLSKAAFNALLKTLEEPPEHIVFILATTDADKLPATIVSRTQRFGFRAIGTDDIAAHLRTIAKQENIAIDDDALALIAARGDGSFRDSISLLDQLGSLADTQTITRTLTEKALGLAPTEHVDKLLAAYEAKDLKTLVALLDENDQKGIQPAVLAHQLIQTLRRAVVEKPQLISLLDALLEVAKSSQPEIKLLTTLASHMTPKPRSAALAAPAPEISASIDELKNQPSKKGMPIGSHQSSHSATPHDKYPQPETEATPGPDFTPDAKQFVIRGSGDGEHKDQKARGSGEFDWEKLLTYTHNQFVAIYSVLSKCGYRYDGTTLTLYTGNGFYKKKLDDSKYRTNLAASLQAIGTGELAIETVGTPPPPKDGVAATVAAIMGGGEEVTVDA